VALGEVEYMHQRRAKAVHWIIGHLKRFLSLTAQRIFYFWFPKMKRPAQTLLRALITILGIGGLSRLRRQSRKAALAFFVVLLTYPLVYYIVRAWPRYDYPIEWMLYFLGAYCLLSGSPPNPRVGLQPSSR